MSTVLNSLKAGGTHARAVRFLTLPDREPHETEDVPVLSGSVSLLFVGPADKCSQGVGGRARFNG